MSIHELDTVVLERDVPEHGLRLGDLGALVHVHDDENIEVEFVRLSGQTQALVQLSITMYAWCAMPTCRLFARRKFGVVPHSDARENCLTGTVLRIVL